MSKMTEIEMAQKEVQSAETAQADATTAAEQAKAALASATAATEAAAAAMAAARTEHEKAERAWDGDTRSWAPVETARRAFEQAELRHRKSQDHERVADQACAAAQKVASRAESAVFFAAGRLAQRKIEALRAEAVDHVRQLMANFRQQEELLGAGDYSAMRFSQQNAILGALHNDVYTLKGWLFT